MIRKMENRIENGRSPHTFRERKLVLQLTQKKEKSEFFVMFILSEDIFLTFVFYLNV